MKKSKIENEKSNIGCKTLLNMAEALNEIRIDFELPDEHLDRESKIETLKEIRDDLINIFWNYDLVKRNKYANDDDK